MAKKEKTGRLPENREESRLIVQGLVIFILLFSFLLLTHTIVRFYLK